MSGRVCFLERSGDVLSGVRLVGLRSEDSWRPRRSDADPDASPVRDAAAAAAWIAERAPDRKVGFLCVDVDGSNCLWLSSPATDPLVLAAALNGSNESSNWFSTDPAEVSIQALAAPKGSSSNQHSPATDGTRLAVLSVPDAMARITIDALDERGIEVERSGSLWHAMALAWDPASPLLSQSTSSEGQLQSQAPVTAVVLIDGAGRLLWAWARSGELLAGGSILTTLSPDGVPRLSKAEVGRLVADWLAWSVQLGLSPARTVCATPELSQSDGGLTARELGAAIGRAWHGATVDLAVTEDPIGATLARLSGADSTPPATADLLTLSRRPRRVHRSMYLWGALAIALAGGALLAVGVKAWRSAGLASAEATKVAGETRKLVLEAAPPPQNDAVLIATAEGNPTRYIEDRLAGERQKQAKPSGLNPVRPILPELENLSFVLGNEGIELEEIRLGESLITVHVYVPDAKVAEDIVDALGRLANEHCDWTIKYPTGTKNNLRLIWLDGAWKGAKQ